jgi:hypothetical protein
MVDTLPIKKFSFDKVTIDNVCYIAKAFGFRFIPIGKSNYVLTNDNAHLGGYKGTLRECNAYLMGWQAKNV